MDEDDSKVIEDFELIGLVNTGYSFSKNRPTAKLTPIGRVLVEFWEQVYEQHDLEF